MRVRVGFDEVAEQISETKKVSEASNRIIFLLKRSIIAMIREAGVSNGLDECIP